MASVKISSSGVLLSKLQRDQRLKIIEYISSKGPSTLKEISAGTQVDKPWVQWHLEELQQVNGVVNRQARWALGDTVPMPVPMESLPEIEKILDRPEVQEHRVSIPTSVASSATDLVGKPDVLHDIVQKLMAGVKSGRETNLSYKSDKDFVDDCVQAYLASCESTLESARNGARGLDGLRDDQATQYARAIYSALTRARLFCIRPERFIITHSIADRFTTERLAGLDWKPYDGSPETERDTEALIGAYAAHGPTWPFPELLPFDSMFLSYGRRLDLAANGVTIWGRISPDMLQNFTSYDGDEPSVYLYGHLIWIEGETHRVFCCMSVETHGPSPMSPEPKRFPPGFIEVYGQGQDGREEQWMQPASLDPWILNMLVRDVNEHKSVSQAWTQTLAQRMDRKKLGKKLKTVLPLPEPFYLVPLKDELIEPPEYRSNAKVSAMVEWSHRWDVRGHEMVRILRGNLPLSPEDAAKLRKRGYRLYLEGRITDPADEERVLKRGVRGPGVNEWIGILSSWRDAFVKGPADKPYVPGARV